MKFLNKSLGDYFAHVRAGIILLAALGAVRFLMLPVFGIPYESGTTYTSTTILILVLGAYYSFTASRNPGTKYRDILGIALALSLAFSIITAVAIAIDDFGGIQTYYTDPAHGGELNPLLHMLGHFIFTIPLTLFLWGLGSVVLKLFGTKRPAMAV